jgi:hypothetical protein
LIVSGRRRAFIEILYVVIWRESKIQRSKKQYDVVRNSGHLKIVGDAVLVFGSLYFLTLAEERPKYGDPIQRLRHAWNGTQYVIMVASSHARSSRLSPLCANDIVWHARTIRRSIDL